MLLSVRQETVINVITSEEGKQGLMLLYQCGKKVVINAVVSEARNTTVINPVIGEARNQ